MWCVFALSGTLFAAGIKESEPNAVVVRIVEVLDRSENPVFNVRTETGEIYTIVADTKTKSDYPLSSLSSGDYIEAVVDETSYASSIRYASPLVAMGAYGDINISRASVMKPVSLGNRFSYTYGYLLFKSLASQGLYFDVDYYVRGTLDSIQVRAEKQITNFFTDSEMTDLINKYQDEVWSQGNAPKEFSGTKYFDLESIGEMEKPTDLLSSFSYAYGYVVMTNMMASGLAVNGPYYAYGMLAYGTGDLPLMSDDEMQQAFTEYQDELKKQYDAQMKEIGEKNLATAEAFLADNKKKDGVHTTESGLQYMPIVESDGIHPKADDTVVFHYILKDLEGNVLQDSHTSSDSTAPTMIIANLVPGLQEGLPLMGIGSTYRFWLHPSLAYGEAGAGNNIYPNECIVFDIELQSIKEK